MVKMLSQYSKFSTNIALILMFITYAFVLILQMSIPSFVKAAFRSTTSLENDHILMHATYLVACSGNVQELHEIAHQTFIKNKAVVQKVSLFLCTYLHYTWCSCIQEGTSQLSVIIDEYVAIIKKASFEKTFELKCLQNVVEGLLLFYFSKYRSPYSKNECTWFVRQCLSGKNPSIMDYSHFGVLQSTLTHILGTPTESNDTSSYSSNVLNLFNSQVNT